MTVSKRDQKLLMFVAALLVFVGGYSGVYTRYNAKTEAVEAEAAALAPRLAELQQYAQNETTYRAAIEDDTAKMEQEIAQYPPDIRAEDQIMFAREMETTVGLSIDGASFAEPEPIMLIESARPAQEDPAKSEKMKLVVYKSAASYVCEAGYEQMKRAVDYVYDASNKSALSSLSISYDNETGKLTGTMAVDQYFITGWDNAYRETPVPRVPVGTANIFRTIPNIPAQ